MARTAITPTALTKDTQNALVLASAGVAIDATNSHVITPPDGYSIDDLTLFITHTTASEKDVTVVAGDNPPATHTSAGDLVCVLGAGNVTAVNAQVPLSGARFSQSDGTVNVDVEASTTGRIAVFYRAKG